MKSVVKKIKLALVVGILALSGVIVYSVTHHKSTTYTITLTNVGFSPAELTIAQGDTVRFVSTRGKEFWPASNIHPSHTIYPEFDPQQPIQPDASWNFTFNRIGAWGYHDHLAPLFIGTITVASIDDALRAQRNEVVLGDCKKESQSKAQCWEAALEGILKKDGLAAAYDAYTQLYSTEPAFAENCHGFTHKLGETAYLEFVQNGEFPVTPQVAYCSYGFFHGFIEAMMQKGGDVSKARDMCAYIDKQLTGKTSTLGACLHGIGHGVTDGSNLRAIGNVEAQISPGLKLCHDIALNDQELKLCATGVFNALAGMYLDPKYKLNLDKKDPFRICRQQETSDIKHACYDDFKAMIFTLGDNDFAKAAKYLEAVKEDTFAQDAMDNLATYYVYFLLKDPDMSQAVATCHRLQARLRTFCISGLGTGLMTAGVPDQDYIRALDFCHSLLLTTDEQAGCFKRVLWLTKNRYSADMQMKICQTVDEKDRYFCTK